MNSYWVNRAAHGRIAYYKKKNNELIDELLDIRAFILAHIEDYENDFSSADECIEQIRRCLP